ncbi:hypothetical protein ACFC5Z_42735 [Streptomyces sp. NPDC056004]|uniref:hypothetical protein n=1 Tax=unclassified Streptomyces TaxID=2593676 RepID=UPI0035E28CB6
MPKESSTGPERTEPTGPVLAVIGCAVGLFPRPCGAAEATVGAEIEVVVDLVGNTFRL